MPQKKAWVLVVLLMLAACAGQRPPRTNPYGLTGMVDEKPEEYGVVVTRVDSVFKEAATLRFSPYDRLTGTSKDVDI
jgi:hypothetical protein